MKFKVFTYIGAYIVASAIIQLTGGGFPMHVMAFPVNIAAAMVWTGMLYLLHSRKGDTEWMKVLEGGDCSILALVLFIAGCLVLGFVPQQSDDTYSLWSRLGVFHFTTSWIFIAILLLLMSNLTLVILRHRSTNKWCQYRFLFNHIGLWLVLFALFFGAPDTHKYRIMAYKNIPERMGYDVDAQPALLNFGLILRSFHVSYYRNGTPSSYKAEVKVDRSPATIEVNKPYAVSWKEKIYLVGYDVESGSQSPYCIFESVVQPWNYIILIGIIGMALGTLLLFVYGSDKHKAGEGVSDVME